ncbi:MAG: hypothetical protein ABI120_15160 [Gemmatimonadaceae bacterium]
MNLLVSNGRRLPDVARDLVHLQRPDKEVALLAALNDQSPETYARLAVGERDRLIMMLHERTFGGRYDCEARCTACHSHMAFSFTASDVGLEPGAVDADALMLTEGRIVVKLRVPNSADLAAVLQSANPAAALFSRCVKVQSSPVHRIGEMRTNDLPASLRQSAIERLAALDPQADLVFELECPSCALDTKVMFDPIAALFHQAASEAPVIHRATLKTMHGGPGSALSDFLERVVQRHLHEAAVHALRLEPAAADLVF